MTNDMKEKNGMNSKKLVAIIISIVALVAVVAVIAVIYVNSISPSRQFQHQLDLGYKYLEELNYEQAIAAFETAIEIDPKNPKPYIGLADAYIGGEGYDRLISLNKEAVKNLDSDEAENVSEYISDTLLTFIDLAIKEGDTELAEELMDILKEIDSSAVIVLSENENGVDGEIVGDMSESSEKSEDVEEIIVDGVLHHGYKAYNFSEYENEQLNLLLSYSQAKNYEAVSEWLMNLSIDCLNSEYWKDIWKGPDNWYSSETYISFRGYKIYLQVSLSIAGEYDNGSSIYYISIIPIESGEGYGMSFVIEHDSSFNISNSTCWWCVGECKEGMFNGAFSMSEKHFMFTDGVFSAVSPWTGNMKNGLADGTLSSYVGNTNMYITNLYADFSCGQPNVIYVMDGVLGKTYKLVYDENGNPQNVEGMFMIDEYTYNGGDVYYSPVFQRYYSNRFGSENELYPF